MLELDRLTLPAFTSSATEFSATFPSASISYLHAQRPNEAAAVVRAIAGIERFTGRILIDGRPVDRVRAGLYVTFADAPLFPAIGAVDNIRLLTGEPVDVVLARSVMLALGGSDHTGDNSGDNTGDNLAQRRRVHVGAAILSGAGTLVFDGLFGAGNGDGMPPETLITTVRLFAPAATVIVAGTSAPSMRHRDALHAVPLESQAPSRQ